MAISLFYSPVYTGAIHPDARFPRMRYTRVYEELLRRQVPARFEEPEPIGMEDLLRVHDTDYVSRFFDGALTVKEQRAIGLRPWTDAMIPRTQLLMGGSLSATKRVLEGAPSAGNLAGGTHHAFRDRGAGYCVFNDLALSATYALEQGVERVLIVDLDVHQGDGTASIFETTPAVFTFSMHSGKNFPFRKTSSDLDLDLPDGAEDEEYLTLLQDTLPRLLDGISPTLVLYQAGVDPLASDRLGRLNLTRKGLRQRNRFVYSQLVERDLPVVVFMGGGYSVPLEDSVAAHGDVFEDMVRMTGGYPSPRI